MKEYILYALCGAFFWGMADIVTKKLLSYGIPNYLIVLGNSLIALVAVSPLIWKFVPAEHVKSAPVLSLLVLNGLLIVAGLFLFYLSVQKGHVAVASAVMSTKILWTLLFSIAVLRSPINAFSVVGILLIAGGLVLLNFGGSKG